ncbi:hypothetical protein ACFU8Q_12880 [Streptomyces sp. NPDC057543]|uniref:hypothetical protein n=1 Tax=Streptomyces sp. NPDC057543 TaxID=3346163 RepID=UPI00369B1709
MVGADELVTVSARYVVDATDLGELLDLAGAAPSTGPLPSRAGWAARSASPSTGRTGSVPDP